MTHRPSTLTAHLRAPLALAATRLGLSSNAPRALKPRARHLLAPLAVAAMLLGLASNAAAQGPGGVPEYSTFPAAQVFTVGVEITPVTLPAASGGDAPLTYTLIPTVPGLTLHPTTRVLTGTPTTAAPLASYFIRAIDVDDETTQINFNITVNAGAPTGLTLSVDPATVTESADATTITITATVVGGTFATDRLVAFASRDGGTATAGTDYTNVPATNLTLPANTASVSTTFPFTADVDTVAEPAGETVYIEGGVFISGSTLAIDSSITVTRAIITINDPPPAGTPTGITLSLDPAAVPESADPTTITITATLVGGTFAVERVIFFQSSAGGNTATVDTDFTAVPFTPLTIPANMASGSTTFPFTAAADSVSEPAGETVHIGGELFQSGSMTLRDNTIPSTFATITINDPVAGDLSPDFAADASIADQSFTVGETVALTLPGVTPGTGNISIHYALTPALPAGLTFNAGVRPQPTITGSPTAAAASAEYTYLVTDGDTNTARTDTDMLTFNLVVTAPVLAFTGNVSTLTLYYPLGAAITATTLPAATGGTSPYMYDTPAGATLPAGLTLDAATRTLSGTPSAAGSSSFNLRVTDSAMPAAMVSLEVTTIICESGGVADGGTVCAAPAFVPLALATPAEQAFRHIVTITTPVTLPEATGGFGANPVRIYTLTPLPVGLAFDPATRVISGRPEAIGTFTVNYRVGDAGAGNADAQSTTVMFDLVVFGRPFLAVIPDQVYVVGDTVALTLTGATGGSPPYTYTLSNQGAGGALTLPAGLTWNTDVSPQTVTGMPTAVTTLANYIYEVTDSRSLTSFKPFSITVNAGADTTPAFAADASIADQFYTVGQTITPLTLPEATGGNGALTYALLVPPGLNFDLSTRVLSGTPTTAATELTYSYFARDADNDGVALLIKITVNAAGAADTAPTFAAGVTIPAQFYVTGKMITPLTFPAATGGDGPIVYSMLAPNGAAITDLSLIIAGLTLDTTARTITGTPSTSSSARNFSWAAHDSDANMASGDRATLGFNITVQENLVPAFAAGASIDDESYIMASPITALTLPTATGGNGAITYTLTPAIPGLTLNPNTGVLTGTPTTAATSAAHTYTATDADDDTVTLTFNVVVAADLVPTLGTATIADQSFVVGDTVALNLPLVTSGTGNISIAYTLTPALPAGLTFDGAARPPTITGSPTAAAATAEYTYMTTDGDGNTAPSDTDMRTFNLVVTAPAATPTGITLSVNPATVTESADATDISLTATFVGGTFAEERVIAFFTGTSGTASAGADYTPVGFTNLTIPANTASVSATFSFTTPVDTVAEPAGETVDITAGLYASGNTMPFDNSISVTPATITINDPVVGDLSPDFAADASIADQTFTVGETVALTLPGVTPGSGNISIHYTLTPALPAGLTFNAAAGVRTITGSPTAAVAPAQYTYLVTDGDTNTARTDTDMLTFNLRVNAEGDTAAPAFAADAAISAQTFTTGTAVDLTLPTATGGNGAITYALTPAVPGLTLDATTGVLSGEPTTAAVAADHTYTAGDTDGSAAGTDEVSLMFSIAVNPANTAPTGITLSLNPATVTESADPTTITVTATLVGGGFTEERVVLYQSTTTGSTATATTDYTPVPGANLTIPANMASGSTTFPFTAAVDTEVESGGETVTIGGALLLGSTSISGVDPSVTVTSATITINDPDTAPAFADDAAISTQNYMVGQSATLTLPVATGGEGDIIYALTPALPAGLTFNAAARPPTITGTPTAVAASVEYTLMVTDGDGNTAVGDTDMLTFSIAVTVAENTIIIVTTTRTATLAAGGATGRYNVRLSEAPPAATTVTVTSLAPATATASPATLTFSTTNWNIGQPVTVTGVTMGTTTIRHSAPDSGIISFITSDVPVTVTATGGVPRGLNVSVRNADDAVVLTGVLEGDTQALDAIATFTPAGSAFPTDEQVTFTVTPAPPASRPDSAADPYVAHTAIAPGTIAIAGGNTNAVFDFSLATTDDAFDHADFPLTVTATASPSGFTATTILTLRDNDIRIVTTARMATLAAGGATGRYNVRLSEAPPAATTVTVASLAPATATASPATLTFSTTNWNIGQPVTVTGVAMGTTTIRHSAPDSGGFSFITGDVPVTVTATGGVPRGLNLSVRNAGDGVVLTGVIEGDTRALDAIATFTPAGSAFPTDEQVTFTVTPAAPASRPDSAADPYVAYTAIAPGTIAIAGGNTNAVFDFSLATTDDAFDHADFPLTVTATASPSGLTATTILTLRDNDISIMTTARMATLAVGATGAYNVLLNAAPPAATTVTVASLAPATATASPATLTFSTTNWNIGQPVTVTGVGAGTTTIRHSAPDSGGFSFITGDVSVAVTGLTTATPVFTSVAAFALPIEVPEGMSTVVSENYFTATATATVTYTLSGADSSRFSISPTGTLTFNTAPDFEMPLGGSNDYTLTVRAIAGSEMTDASITVRVTNVNEAPINAAITIAGSATSVTNPATLGVSATAADPDAGTTLIYTWSSDATGDSFSPATGASVTWTPPTVTAATMFTLTVTVSDGATPALTTTATQEVTVNPMPAPTPPTGLTLSLNPATVMESADPTTITITATVVGGTFTVERVVRFSSFIGGTATEVTDYTTVPSTDFTIPANMASASTTFPFTAAVDTDAEPAGETAIIGGSLLTTGGDIDTSIAVTNATITINDPAPVVDTAPSFSVASFPAQTFTMGTAVDLTLPAATGGNGAITYALTPAIPGLTLDAATGVLSGTPTTVAAAATYTYTAGDTDGSAAGTDEATLTFSITVATAVRPTFFALAGTTFMIAEGTAMVASPTTFLASAGSATVALTLSGPDAGLFSVTDAGALTFNTAPDFEMPRGMPFVAGTNTNTYNVTITATATPGGLTRDAILIIRVTDVDETPDPGTDTAPTFGDVTVSPQVFTIGTAVDLTLPAATGGNGAITYALAPAIPGLTLDAATGVLTGTPTTAATATDYTYTAGDTDGSAAGTDEATLTISITVNEMTVTPTIPTFGDATIDDMTYTQGTTITPVTLPVATGGDTTLFYSVTSALPDGLTFTPATRVLSGTPTTVGMTTQTYRVADIRANAVELMFTITVNAPAGGGTPPTSQTLTISPTAVTESATPTDITATVTLNGGTFSVARAFSIGTQGGNAAVDDDYAAVNLTLTLPANTATGSLVIPFTAVLDTVAEPAGETVMIASSLLNLAETAPDLAIPEVTATLTINDAPASGDTAPSFGGATIEAQTYTQGTAITPLTLPVATGGNGAITYTLTPALPTGLIFNATARTITGTASTAAGATMHTYTAADGDDNTDADDSASLMFSITVEANTAPDFGATTPFEPSETIVQNRMITPITLPAATGGNGDITYTLAALPAGLTFDGTTRVISGTPESVVAEMDYTYTAADSDGSTGAGDEATLVVRFAVVQAPPTRIDLSVNPAAVTESTTATTITVTATLIEGTFTDERRVTLSASSDSTATAGTDYTPEIAHTITIPANATSGTATFMFTADVDTVAEPGGETVIIGRNLATAGGTGAVDRDIPVSPRPSPSTTTPRSP